MSQTGNLKTLQGATNSGMGVYVYVCTKWQIEGNSHRKSDLLFGTHATYKLDLNFMSFSRIDGDRVASSVKLL